MGDTGVSIVETAEQQLQAARAALGNAQNAVMQSLGCSSINSCPALNFLSAELDKQLSPEGTIADILNILKTIFGDMADAGIEDVVSDVVGYFDCIDGKTNVDVRGIGPLGEWDTSHTNCEFHGIGTFEQNCWLDWLDWFQCKCTEFTLVKTERYLVKSCVEQHLNDVRNEIQAQEELAKKAAIATARFNSNQDALAAKQFDMNRISCNTEWKRGVVPLGTDPPLEVVCSAPTFLKSGGLGPEVTVAREAYIDRTSPATVKSSKTHLVDFAKFDLLKKLTGNMNGGFLGCYKDDFDRALPTAAGIGKTKEECIQTCEDQGFKFAGREALGECW